MFTSIARFYSNCKSAKVFDYLHFGMNYYSQHRKHFLGMHRYSWLCLYLPCQITLPETLLPPKVGWGIYYGFTSINVIIMPGIHRNNGLVLTKLMINKYLYETQELCLTTIFLGTFLLFKLWKCVPIMAPDSDNGFRWTTYWWIKFEKSFQI